MLDEANFNLGAIEEKWKPARFVAFGGVSEGNFTKGMN